MCCRSWRGTSRSVLLLFGVVENFIMVISIESPESKYESLLGVAPHHSFHVMPAFLIHLLALKARWCGFSGVVLGLWVCLDEFGWA